MTRPITDADMSKRAAEMEPWYWWGLPTFYKCPWNGDPAACDIGLVGVPHSSGNGSTERDQHLAPARRAPYVGLVSPGPSEIRLPALG